MAEVKLRIIPISQNRQSLYQDFYPFIPNLNGSDIYTVSKILGHRELKTTQIYAKIVDKSKREATERIKLNL